MCEKERERKRVSFYLLMKIENLMRINIHPLAVIYFKILVAMERVLKNYFAFYQTSREHFVLLFLKFFLSNHNLLQFSEIIANFNYYQILIKNVK